MVAGRATIRVECRRGEEVVPSHSARVYAGTSGRRALDTPGGLGSVPGTLFSLMIRAKVYLALTTRAVACEFALPVYQDRADTNVVNKICRKRNHHPVSTTTVHRGSSVQVLGF